MNSQEEVKKSNKTKLKLASRFIKTFTPEEYLSELSSK